MEISDNKYHQYNLKQATMKSPKNSLTPTPSKQQELENDLILTMGNQLSESARAIFNIKQSLYELMKINVTASVPIRKYDTTPAILAGAKRNLDDLRRIQSMLKGYLNTIRLESDNSSEDVGLGQIAMTKSAMPSFNPYSVVANLQNNETSPSNNLLAEEFLSISQIAPKEKKNTLNKNRKENIQTKQKPQDKKNVLTQQEQKKKQQDSKAKGQDSPSQTKQSIEKTVQEISSKIVKQVQIEQAEKQGESHEKVRVNKLTNCKSAIFSTSRNLEDIRTRNRKCLELIRSIRKQIGLEAASVKN